MKFAWYGKALAGALLVGGVQGVLAEDRPQLFREASSFRAHPNLKSDSTTFRSLRTGASTGTIDLSVLKEDFVIALGSRTAYGSVKNFADWSSSITNPIETVSGMLLDKEGGSEIGTFAFSYDTISHGSVFGSFSLYDGDIFEITGSELLAQLHRVTKDLPECATNFSHEVHHGDHSARVLAPQPLSDGATTVDVLVAYSPEARAAAGSVAAMESEIASAVSLANTAYANSQVNISLRLVGTTAVNSSESGSFNTDLTRLTTNGDGIWDDVHSSRNTVGADIVVLFINNSTSCGLGWVMTNPSVSDDRLGFSVVSRQCISNFSFVHEIGHNMGATHDRDNAGGSTGAYADSYGWRFAGASGRQWRSVMAYQSQSGTPNYTRINYFSNPDVSYDGAATGSPNSANNAKTLNLTRNITASYRAAPTSAIPTPTSTPTATNTPPPGSTPTENPSGGSGSGGAGVVPTPFELAPTPEPTQTTPGSSYNFELRLQRRGNTLNLVVGVTYNNEFIVTNQAVQLINASGKAQSKMLQSNGKAKFKVRKGKSYQIEIDGVFSEWFKVRG